MPRYIKTHRSKDLNKSALVVSKYLIDKIKKQKKYKMNDMYLYLKDKLNIQSKEFMYALNFLYILGVLEYEKRDDTLRYLK